MQFNGFHQNSHPLPLSQKDRFRTSSPAMFWNNVSNPSQYISSMQTVLSYLLELISNSLVQLIPAAQQERSLETGEAETSFSKPFAFLWIGYNFVTNDKNAYRVEEWHFVQRYVNLKELCDVDTCCFFCFSWTKCLNFLNNVLLQMIKFWKQYF